ncbi:MAG: FecR domain-containing protein [Sedimentisphaerales bacterium]|nr:FecR domain-containing protein [Sedimentisphaerales bacterium]
MLSIKNYRQWLVIALVTTLAAVTYAQPAADEPAPEPTVNTEPETTMEPVISTLPEGVAGVIIEVNGEHAQYTTDGENWQPAQVNAQLTVNSSVRTGFNSNCSVQMGNNSVIRVEPISSLKMADYVADAGQETVRANLQYGAVRCGVSHSNITTDTAISTPVSTLSIRGTDIYAEYDPGTRQVSFRVDHDGPGLVIPQGGGPLQFQASTPGDSQTAGRTYQLEEGMGTDGDLSRHLGLETQERTSWGGPNGQMGDISQLEALAIVFQNGGSINPTDGFEQFLGDDSRFPQLPPINVLDDPRSGGSGTNGECPLCPHDD